MNWVGGARSRVRQHAEKKIQKDFFEKKRLAGKVQRIRPSLSKVKTSISQDLLFLKATASASKSIPGRVTHVPKPISLERSGNNKDGLSMRAQQHDVELPMSPINRASSLELMDTTTTSTNATFLSNTGAGDGGGGGGRRGLEKLPRVSTQKIPHNTILDSFGPPRNMEDFEVDALPGESHMVPSEDNHLLNVSAMTESLFPPPVKRRREHHKEMGNRKATKKYDLDSMLHQNLNNGSHSKHARSKGAKVIAAPQGKGHTGGQNQDEHKSLFLIAQGGWCRPENGEEYRQDKEKKPTGYQFDFWSVAAPAKKEKVWPKHPLGKPPGLNLATSEECELELHYATETGTGGRSSEAVTVATEDPGQVVPAYGAAMPSHGKNGGHGWKGKSKLDESRHGSILPWLSSMKSTSSVLSENPFSERKMPRVFAGPPVSTSVDFDESVFGPLRHHVSSRKDARGEPSRGRKSLANQSILAPIRKAKRGPHSHEPTAWESDESILVAAKNTGMRIPNKEPPGRNGATHMPLSDGDESILAPVKNARKGISHDSRREDETLPPPIHAARDTGIPKELLSQGESNESILGPFKDGTRQKEEVSGGVGSNSDTAGMPNRKRSAFEMMMASLEDSSAIEKREEADNEGSNDESEVHHQLQGSSVPHEASLPDSGQVSALPLSTASNGQDQKSKPYISTAPQKTHPGNISVLHELMCLEEEISSHYEDGLLSQNTPVEHENSEDPLFKQASGASQGSENRCSFASSPVVSLEKVLLPQATSSQRSNSSESSECTATLKVQNLMDVQNIPTENRLMLPTGNGSNINCSISPLGPEISTKVTASNCKDVQTDLIVTSSAIQPSAESACGAVANTTEQHSTVGTQTSDFGTLTTCSSEPQRLTNSEQEKLNNDGLANAETTRKMATSESGNVSPAQSSVQLELTNENLTVGLEKYVISERTEEASSSCSVGCQTISEEIPMPAHVGSVPFKASRLGGLKGITELEVEGLRQRIAELEEKVLATETTVVWQAIMIKCLNSEINDK